jgi:outer membrane protein
MRLLLLALLLAAQTTVAANLSAIYQQARERDPLYTAAQAADRAGREKLPQARAGLLPSLVMGAFLRQTHSDSSVSSSSSYSSPGLSLSLSQPLWRVQNREAYAQGALQAQLAEQQLRVADQELLLRSARAYFDLLQAENALATARAQKAAIAEQLAQAKKSFEVGTATITDTHEAQARFDLTAAEEIAAGNELEIKRASLERLIGGSAPGLARLDEKAAMPRPDPERLDDWLQRAGEEALPVRLARTGLDIASHELARQRGGHQPTLDLTATASDVRNQTISGVSGIDSRSGVIGLELNWPLYQGGLVDSRIREAQANLDRADRKSVV